MSIKIVSDGTVTKVFTMDGKELTGITSLILAQDGFNKMQATLTFHGPEVEVVSEVRRPLVMEYRINGENYVKAADMAKLREMLKAVGLM